jgi:hypothetical protein
VGLSAWLDLHDGVKAGEKRDERRMFCEKGQKNRRERSHNGLSGSLSYLDQGGAVRFVDTKYCHVYFLKTNYLPVLLVSNRPKSISPSSSVDMMGLRPDVKQFCNKETVE